MNTLYGMFCPRKKEGDEGTETALLEPEPSATRACFDAAQREIYIKTLVTAVFIFPFVLSSVDIAKRYPVGGVVFGIVANGFIARIAWTFYARHFVELFDNGNELQHIQQHLRTADHQIAEMQPWSMQYKTLVLFAVLLSTLPLGLTKIGLDDNFDLAKTSLRIAYLTAYAVIDAGPHINHLQLQSQAITKFLELSWLTKTWIFILMAGHALSDSADLWNAQGFWFYWVCAALVVEFYLSNVEAVAHQKPHIPEVNLTSMTKLTILFLGAVSMAIFNWYNTFKDSTVPMNSSSKIIFVFLQLVNVLFVTFEAWHHEAEAKEVACNDTNCLGHRPRFYQPPEVSAMYCVVVNANNQDKKV